jgi:hypothetical protein
MVDAAGHPTPAVANESTEIVWRDALEMATGEARHDLRPPDVFRPPSNPGCVRLATPRAPKIPGNKPSSILRVACGGPTGNCSGMPTLLCPRTGGWLWARVLVASSATGVITNNRPVTNLFSTADPRGEVGEKGGPGSWSALRGKQRSNQDGRPAREVSHAAWRAETCPAADPRCMFLRAAPFPLLAVVVDPPAPLRGRSTGAGSPPPATTPMSGGSTAFRPPGRAFPTKGL